MLTKKSQIRIRSRKKEVHQVRLIQTGDKTNKIKTAWTSNKNNGDNKNNHHI